MRNIRTLFISLSLLPLIATSQDFTWIKGSNLIGQTGIYGSMGVSAPANNPGGRREPAAGKDNAGMFWLFGGDGHDFIGNLGLMNDLWRYNPATNEWTWMKGDNIIAQNGNYGTKGVTASTNKPGCRSSAMSWMDASGNFWIFGGYGYDGGSTLGYLNDLWRYNQNTNQWTWMAGSNTANQQSNYGSKGVPANTNSPGARLSGASWIDNSGNFYLLGGSGYAATSTVGLLNDLWKYDAGTNQWTWIGGYNITDQNGVYGTMGTASLLNIPGARAHANTWKDNSNNLWLIAGFGMDAASTAADNLNDLWKYDVTLNQWTWVRGSNTKGQNGVYGNQGVSNAANNPGARSAAVTWTDATGALWLFGGSGNATSSTSGQLNDLWRYNVATDVWTWIRGSAINNQAGFYGTQGVQSVNNRPGGRHLQVGWSDGSSNLYLFGGDGYAANATNQGPLNDLWKYNNCFITPITMTIIAQDSVLCAGESTSLTASGSNNYQWSVSSFSTAGIVVKPGGTTTYTVFTNGLNNCQYSASFTETVLACAGLKVNSVNKDFQIFPNPSRGLFKVISNTNNDFDLIIYNALGMKVHQESISGSASSIQTNLPHGVYFYSIMISGKEKENGKLIIAD